MDVKIIEKSKTIDCSSSNKREPYFNGLKLSKEKPVKPISNLNGKEKEKETIQIKSLFNKSNTNIVSCILQFLEFKDIIEFQHTNKHFQKLLGNKKILRNYALRGVLDAENRLIFYETFINVQEIKLNLRNELSKYNIRSNIYKNILHLANDFKEKDEKFSYVHEQISKDINRTFYTEKFKSGNGKEMLYNILLSIAFIRPEIGYCQGMNFIVGALINFIDNEEKCFWIFLYFIDSIGLKMLYLQNVPDYLIKLYQLNYFVKENFPKLFPHLKRNQINPDIFFSKWILTIFSNFSYVSEQISKDLNRTFYTEKYKTGNGKIMLNNILTAIAFIRPDIGYCQGMNFIVGSLINFIDNEEKCFWIFLHFIDNLELKSLYLQKMPDYLIKLYQLNYFIKDNFPKLLPHLKINQINPDIFFSKWILTIFSNFLPFETLYNVWDLFVLDKWKAIFKFSIIIVYYMKDKLMNMDLFSFSSYVRNNGNINLLKFADLAKYYKDYKVSNKKLMELREDFFVEELKAKLELGSPEWANEQTDYIINYQSELNNFIHNLKKPIEKLQEQIAKINLECEQKSKKYEQKLSVVKDIKSKLEKEIEIKTEYENSLKQFMPNLPTECNDVQNNISNNNIHALSSKKIKQKPEKVLSPINKNYKKSETQKLKKAESTKKRKIKFPFNLKGIIKRNANESEKLLKKLNSIKKKLIKIIKHY